MKAIFMVRATSVRFLECVNLYLLSCIKHIQMEQSESIPSFCLPLFTGLNSLSQMTLPQTNDETLSLMPWIKDLIIQKDFNVLDDCFRDLPPLTESGLHGLTNLVSLSIQEPTKNQVKCLSKLVNLEKLDIRFNKCVSDKELPFLTSLTYLHLYNDRKFKGVCFTQMPHLKNLALSGASKLVIEDTNPLVIKLESLSLWYCGVISPSTIMRMTNLKQLQVEDTRGNYETIKSLTSLTSLILTSVDLDDDTLMHLTQLCSLELSYVHKITSKTIAHLSPSLRKLSVVHCASILPSDFLYCTNLTQLYHVSNKTTTAQDVETFKLLADRGVNMDKCKPR